MEFEWRRKELALNFLSTKENKLKNIPEKRRKNISMEEFLEREELLGFCAIENIGEIRMKEAKVRFSTKKNERKSYGTDGISVTLLQVLHINYTLDVHWSELPDGTVHGECASFYGGGNKATSCNLVDGKVEGKYFVWFFRTGKIMVEMDFADGKLHGSYTQWMEDGTFERRYTFVKGIMLDCDEAYGSLCYRKRLLFSFPNSRRKSGFCVGKTFDGLDKLLVHGMFVYEEKEKGFISLNIPMVNCVFSHSYELFGVENRLHTHGNHGLCERREIVGGEITNITNWRRDGSLERTWHVGGEEREWPIPA